MGLWAFAGQAATNRGVARAHPGRRWPRLFGTSLTLMALWVWGSASAVTCAVAGFEPHDNLRLSGGTGTLTPGSNRVHIPISSSTERCAQVRIECEGPGGTLIDAEDLTARFVDGKERTARLGFKTGRIYGGEGRTLFTCFGTSEAPIVEIRGRF